LNPARFYVFTCPLVIGNCPDGFGKFARQRAGQWARLAEKKIGEPGFANFSDGMWKRFHGEKRN
jgi:hypothetical protein